jgi:hypothetical protein
MADIRVVVVTRLPLNDAEKRLIGKSFNDVAEMLPHFWNALVDMEFYVQMEVLDGGDADSGG